MIPKCRWCGNRVENAGLNERGETMYRDLCWKCHEHRNVRTSDPIKRLENFRYISENYKGGTVF